MASATAPAPKAAGQKAVRPSARPQPKNSRHALEPNPFEQSFSSKPSDSASSPEDSASTAGRTASGDDAAKAKATDKNRSSPSASSSIKQEPVAAEAAAAPRRTAAAKDSTTGTITPGKRALPPVASLTSPNHEGGNAYPWGPSSLGSLRAGPLSPAMLTGPQHHLSHLNHFDPSNFRTGFTPDLSNFKTGLTPLGSASGFPPPSPGTAAFLAMVNGNGPAMTPNTFHTLTNHASSLLGSGDHTGITPMQSDVRNGGQGSQSHGDFDLAFGKQQQQSQPPPQQQQQHFQQPQTSTIVGRQKLPPGKSSLATGSTADLSKSGQPKVEGTQGAAGLFLLSQAHQELSKRDQQQAAQSQQPIGMVQTQSLKNGASSTGQQAASTSTTSGNAGKVGTKRKKSSASANPNHNASTNDGANGGNPAPTNDTALTTSAVKGSKKTKRIAKSESIEDDLNDSDDDSRDDSKEGEGDVGSGGDDEEKRKNFLERNRQAALKCRQRKKAWLQDLQSKVAFYEAENGGLQETVGQLRNEVMFLKSELMQMSQHQPHPQIMAPGMLPPHPGSQNGPNRPGIHAPQGLAQSYGGPHPPHPPQGGRGPSQGPTFSPASQAA